ncbi:tetratricopeptide repeat protein [Asticcacaulis sp. BYS171W]|uniref:Tetratricopeptide repeat protein n=1 Tax=Asticcacaulis aquaticus TaxID=2984212 RepID=A0ABT5HV85_9CAUL|nr:tetratricopeptide repeat protein [Asticcacaulis aquaticus]MDC7683985.1 tetratricopeptide repeat protein [Asticcacaulis aquaticus]
MDIDTPSNAERLGQTYFFAFIDDDLGWDDVLAATEAHLIRDPRNRYALHNRAQALFARDRFAEAEQHYRAGLAEGADDSLPFYAFGQFLSLRKRPAEAAEMFREALRFEPEDAPLWRCLAYALGEAWRFPSAVAAFTRAIELEPDFARTVLDRGWARALTGDMIGAVRDWRRAASLRKDSR